MLSRSQPPSVDDVEQLLHKAKSPFDLDERLAELADELQSEYPDHDLTEEVVDAVEGTSSQSEKRELIEHAEELLDGVDEQLRRIRETMDELPDGSVVMVDPLG
jgi:HEPN domain-containing protein